MVVQLVYVILMPFYVLMTRNHTQRIILISFSLHLTTFRNQYLTQLVQFLTNVTGDTAVYLMFAFARVASILRKVGNYYL